LTPLSLALWQRLRRLDVAGCTISIQRRVPIGCGPGHAARVWYSHVGESARLAWQGVYVERPDLPGSVEDAVAAAEARGWGRPCDLPATVPIDEDLWERLQLLDRACMTAMGRGESFESRRLRVWRVSIRKVDGVRAWDNVHVERPGLREALLAAVEDAEGEDGRRRASAWDAGHRARQQSPPDGLTVPFFGHAWSHVR
jgi:hypothetical protein